MSDIIQALLNAVETREIDLGECSEIYAGVKIPVRVNWTRAQKKRRWELVREYNQVVEELKERAAGENLDDLNSRADTCAAGFLEWWAGVFQFSADDMQRFKDALPDPHWNWLVDRILLVQSEYEITETKKVGGLRGLTSEKQEQPHPTSGNDSALQDGSTQSAAVPFSHPTTSN